MRKIFSFMLIAAGLLIGTQSWAKEYSVENWTELKDAFAEIAGSVATYSPATITLNSSSGTIIQEDCITIQNGEVITLNMNGQTIKMTTEFGNKQKQDSKDKSKMVAATTPINFIISHGQMHIQGGGSILNYTESTAPAAGKLPSYAAKGGGGLIYCFHLLGSETDVDYGYTTLTVDQGTQIAVLENNTDANPAVYGGKCAIDIYPVNTTDGGCYGLTLNFNGSAFGNKYGIQASGILKATSGHIPVINIQDNATVSGSSTDTQGCGLYVGGYAIVTVKGDVQGATGAYIKSGEVTFDGAKVTSTWEGDYVAPVSGKGSGVEAGGSAIVVNSAAAYQGDIEVVIKGETEAKSSTGYAIDERVDNNTESEVEKLIIESGTFSAPKGQTIIISDVTTATATSDVQVIGGTWTDNAALSIISKDKGSIIIETENDKGQTVYNISNTGNNTVVDWKDIDMTDQTAATYFKYKGNTEKVVGDDQGTVTTVKAKYLWMAENSKLTIKKNATVIVDQVEMAYLTGDPDVYSQIIIEAGGKLLVTGYQGIYSRHAENIVVKSNGTDHMGVLLFHPEVGSNKDPYATVEYYAANACALDENSYNWDIFVSPFSKISEITNNNSEGIKHSSQSVYGSSYQHWNGKKWTGTKADLLAAENAAFLPIAITNTSDASKGKVTYTFKGKLQGNISGKFTLGKGYMYLGNAFLAPMDATQILSKVSTNNLEQKLWIWENQDFKYIDDISLGTQLPKMPAMGFFIIRTTTSGSTIDLDYKTLVWEYNNTQNL